MTLDDQQPGSESRISQPMNCLSGTMPVGYQYLMKPNINNGEYEIQTALA